MLGVASRKKRERKRERIKKPRERELILWLKRFSGDLPATAAQRCNIQTTFLRARWRLACTYHRWLHGGGYTLSFFPWRVTSLSFSLSFFPQISCITFAGNTYGIKPRVLSTSLSYSFFFRLIPVSSFFLVSSPPRLLSKEQRDIQKMSTKRANLPFFSISTWLIARLRTTGIELPAVVWNSASLFCEILVASWSTRTNGLLRFISPSSIMNSATDQIYTRLTVAKGSIVMRFFRTIWDDRVLNERFIGRLLSHGLSS